VRARARSETHDAWKTTTIACGNSEGCKIDIISRIKYLIKKYLHKRNNTTIQGLNGNKF
jgi:hypothetical protein